MNKRNTTVILETIAAMLIWSVWIAYLIVFA